MDLAKPLRPLVTTLAPEPWLQRVRARRRGPLFRAAGVVFVHVPRAAGTSLAEALYGRFIGHFGITDLLATGCEEVLALPRFAVGRNPWDRAVSAWSFAREGGGRGRTGRVRVARPGQYDDPAFASFDRFVLEWLPARPLLERDGIFRPQTAYLTRRDGSVPLDYLGRLHRIEETRAWLSDTLGREIALGRENASPRREYRSYYSPETRDAIARLYRADIALLGAEF